MLVCALGKHTVDEEAEVRQIVSQLAVEEVVKKKGRGRGGASHSATPGEKDEGPD